jgi:hypothetical protein
VTIRDVGQRCGKLFMTCRLGKHFRRLHRHKSWDFRTCNGHGADRGVSGQLYKCSGKSKSFPDIEVAYSFLRGSGWSTGVENVYRGATDIEITIVAYV